MRIAAAFAVLVSHSFHICATPENNSFHSFVTLGYYSVALFFCLSGFLISKSWLNSGSLGKFVIARISRIYPGLWCCLLLTISVLGPLVSSVSVAEYFTSRLVPVFAVWNGTLLKTRFELPGVFIHNPFPKTVNGSMWTLPFEIYCYAATATAGVVGLLSRKRICTIFAVVTQIVFVAKTLGCVTVESDTASRLIDVGSQFATGVALYVNRDRVSLRWDWFAVTILACLVAMFAPEPAKQSIWHIALPLIVFCMGYLPTRNGVRFRLANDVSYGFYIYAFPIQQLGVFLFPQMHWGQNVLFAAPLTYVLAWMSWKFVEKPSLGYGQNLRLHLYPDNKPLVNNA